MTTQLDYAERGRRFFARLRAYIEADLAALAVTEPEMAERLTEAYHAKRARLITEVDLAADETAATDLAYRFDLLVDDKWIALCRMHWSRLMDNRADAIAEVRMTMWQNGLDIPDDVSELTGD
jgi:hypothetical protein